MGIIAFFQIAIILKTILLEGGYNRLIKILIPKPILKSNNSSNEGIHFIGYYYKNSITMIYYIIESN